MKKKPGSDLVRSERIYQCIVELRERNHIPTRQVISAMLNLKMMIVDDHVKRLKDNGRIFSPIPGVFEPCEDPALDQAVSTTMLPTGGVIVEKGDDVMKFTMREARMLSAQLYGLNLQFPQPRTQQWDRQRPEEPTSSDASRPPVASGPSGSLRRTA